jgi:hypothetical protein
MISYLENIRYRFFNGRDRVNTCVNARGCGRAIDHGRVHANDRVNSRANARVHVDGGDDQ